MTGSIRLAYRSVDIRRTARSTLGQPTTDRRRDSWLHTADFLPILGLTYATASAPFNFRVLASLGLQDIGPEHDQGAL